MNASELNVYRGVAALLALITFLGWGLFDSWGPPDNVYFALMVSALVVAACCRINAYRSAGRRFLGAFYSAAIVTALVFAYREFAVDGIRSGSLGIAATQIGLLGLLARAAFLSDVRTDV